MSRPARVFGPGGGVLAAAALLVAVPQLHGCKGCKGCHETGVTGPGSTGDEEFDHDWGQWLSMALMPDGAPAVAYYDRTQEGLGFAQATLTDGQAAWAHEQVDGYPDDQGLDVGDRGRYASMAIAPDGRAWIAYYDAGTRALRYASRDPGDGTWTSGIADTGEGATPDAGRFASLALDADNNPVIAHYDVGKARLRVAHWNGSSFSGEVVDQGEDYVPADTAGETREADVGRYAKLMIAGAVEYVAYYDAAAGDLKLAVGSSGSYAVEVVDSEGDVGAWPDMLMDEDGNIHIAYHDVGDQDLMYAVGTPGSWSRVTVDDDEYVGADAEIFMNGDYPAVLYFDGRNNDLKIARNSGEDWQTDTVAGSEAALGYHNEVVATGGVHYAACYDYTNRSIWFSALD